MCDPTAVGTMIAFLTSMGFGVKIIVNVLKSLIKKYVAEGDLRKSLIRLVALAVCAGISAAFIALKGGDWGCLLTYASELFVLTQFTQLVKLKKKR